MDAFWSHTVYCAASGCSSSSPSIDSLASTASCSRFFVWTRCRGLSESLVRWMRATRMERTRHTNLEDCCVPAERFLSTAQDDPPAFSRTDSSDVTHRDSHTRHSYSGFDPVYADGIGDLDKPRHLQFDVHCRCALNAQSGTRRRYTPSRGAAPE